MEERLIYSLTDDEFQGYLNQREALEEEEAEAAIEAERWDEDEPGPQGDFETLRRDLDRSLGARRAAAGAGVVLPLRRHWAAKERLFFVSVTEPSMTQSRFLASKRGPAGPTVQQTMA